jgi:hypothetical protein
MTVTEIESRRIAPVCSICNFDESVVRSVITEPLISTVTYWVCRRCLPIHRKAVVQLAIADRDLIVFEGVA